MTVNHGKKKAVFNQNPFLSLSILTSCVFEKLTHSETLQDFNVLSEDQLQ
ncbi:hypothetical protein PsAD26_05449 [Pseudovibrio sp. Ad26]|nr:hypothetical protein PsAD26_05449 [Pseudovibrio sp. Ad26]